MMNWFLREAIGVSASFTVTALEAPESFTIDPAQGR